MQALLASTHQHAAASAELQRAQRADLTRCLLACTAAGQLHPRLLAAWAPRLLAMVALGRGLLHTQLVRSTQVGNPVLCTHMFALMNNIQRPECNAVMRLHAGRWPC